jgi:hypothetical protein
VDFMATYDRVRRSLREKGSARINLSEELEGRPDAARIFLQSAAADEGIKVDIVETKKTVTAKKATAKKATAKKATAKKATAKKATAKKATAKKATAKKATAKKATA